jgi:NifB/MoaA-like Fe-S oxidoreductase
MKKAHGVRMFYPADELYLKAERALPDEDFYDGYPQIENGVGMITSTLTEFYDELDYIDEYLGEVTLPRTVSIATGEAAYCLIKSMALKLEEKINGLRVNVYKIRNDFFGESITVAGLLTGRDMVAQLEGKELGDLLLFPENSLRADGDLFLDDMSPEELSDRLGVIARPGHNDGAQFIRDVLGV